MSSIDLQDMSLTLPLTCVTNMDHSFSTFAKFYDKSSISYLLIRRRMFTYQGVRNVSFSEKIAYALNE